MSEEPAKRKKVARRERRHPFVVDWASTKEKKKEKKDEEKGKEKEMVPRTSCLRACPQKKKKRKEKAQKVTVRLSSIFYCDLPDPKKIGCSRLHLFDASSAGRKGKKPLWRGRQRQSAGVHLATRAWKKGNARSLFLLISYPPSDRGARKIVKP